MTVSRQDRWTRATDIPLIVAAAIFTVAYAWEVIGELRGPEEDIAQTIIWATWAAFAVDFIVKLVLAERRVRWFFTHFLDFLLVALPVLRPLRLLRVPTLWSVVQRIFGRAFRGRVAIYVIGSSFMLVFIAALAELEAERTTAHARITNFGEALWWAFETITTVGYGDYEPVTFEGRLVAVALMIAGIALLGVVTATLAAWLLSHLAVVEEEEATETRSEISELVTTVQALREELALMRTESGRTSTEA